MATERQMCTPLFLHAVKSSPSPNCPPNQLSRFQATQSGELHPHSYHHDSPRADGGRHKTGDGDDEVEQAKIGIRVHVGGGEVD